MPGRIVLNAPDDPKLSLCISIENGKVKAATNCAFCGDPLQKGELNFASEVRLDVAICKQCVKHCFEETMKVEFAPMQEWIRTHGDPDTVDSAELTDALRTCQAPPGESDPFDGFDNDSDPGPEDSDAV